MKYMAIVIKSSKCMNTAKEQIDFTFKSEPFRGENNRGTHKRRYDMNLYKRKYNRYIEVYYIILLLCCLYNFIHNKYGLFSNVA